VRGHPTLHFTVDLLICIDEFEVSIFLTEISTRHALMVKQKSFAEQKPIRSNSSKLLGNPSNPVMVGEEDDEDDVRLRDIPEAEVPDDSSSDTGFEPAPGAMDDKKKLAFDTTYEGFNIWGFVLCLLVERKGGPGKKVTSEGQAQALMEEWISTQQQQNYDD
jgi:hypothetical protein